jgi:hypothetical protein
MGSSSSALGRSKGDGWYWKRGKRRSYELLHCSAMAVEWRNRQREGEENGESKEAGLSIGFFPFGGATWRACDERARHAAAKGYGRSVMTSTPAVQLEGATNTTAKLQLNIKLPPFVTHKPFSSGMSCSNKSSRATRDLQLFFKCQSLIQPGSRDTRLQSGVHET